MRMPILSKLLLLWYVLAFILVIYCVSLNCKFSLKFSNQQRLSVDSFLILTYLALQDVLLLCMVVLLFLLDLLGHETILILSSLLQLSTECVSPVQKLLCQYVLITLVPVQFWIGTHVHAKAFVFDFKLSILLL